MALDDLCADAEEPDSAAQKPTDMGRAWEGLQSLKRGMQDEFQRFHAMACGSAYPSIRKLHEQLRSYKALADRGTLVYRDVLDGGVPDTLADIFAFASLSHAISEILVRQGRMQETDILTGLQRWRDCIHDSDEKDAFDMLVSSMWPSRWASPPLQKQPPSFDPHGREGSLHVAENSGNHSNFLEPVAASIAAEIGRLPKNLSDPGQPRAVQPLSMEEEVLGVTDLTEQEFSFSQLRSLGDHGNLYVAPKDLNDTRDVEWWRVVWLRDPEYPIPRYAAERASPYTSPVGIGLPDLGMPIPSDRMPPILASSPSSSRSQRLLQFQDTDNGAGCAVQNLRNTVAFLAVFVFVKNTGEYLFLLSGSGKTVARSRSGSAYAHERSKAENRLRKGFFEPLKSADAKDARFLALLAVAEKFVALGLLRTDEEVQDYLLTVAKVSGTNSA